MNWRSLVLLTVVALAPLSLVGGAPASSEKSGDDMKSRMEKMNQQMVEHLGKGDKHFEKRFIDMMIPHHQGAIMSAEHALMHSTQPELKAMLEKSIAEQKKEIKQLEEWRREWYGEEDEAKR